MIKNIITSFLLLFSTGLFSQDIIKRIPYSSAMVFGFNFQEVNSKLNAAPVALKDKLYGSFTTKFNEALFTSLVNNAEASGIKKGTYSYYAFSTDKKINFYFEISNTTAFEKTISDIFKKLEVSTQTTKEANIKYLYAQNIIVGITSNIAIISIEQRNFYYGYDDMYWKEKQQQRSTADSILQAAFQKNPSGNHAELEKKFLSPDYYTYEKNFQKRKEKAEEEFYSKLHNDMKSDLKQLLEGSKVSSLADNSKFKEIATKKADGFFWVNTSVYFNATYLRSLGMEIFPRARRNKFSDTIQVDPFFENNFSYGYVKLNNGSIQLDFVNETNEIWTSYTKKMLSKTPSPALFNYVSSASKQGIYYTCYNLKAIGEFYEMLYLKVFEDLAKNDPRRSTELGIAELALAFLDKETLFNSLNGNMLLTFNGFKEITTKIKTYEMDEDFNYVTKEVEQKKELPEFVFAGAIGDKERMMKLFNAVLKLPNVNKTGEGAMMISASATRLFDLYISVIDDVLVVTNNKTVIESKGVPVSERITKAEIQKITAMPSYMYWNMDATFGHFVSKYKAGGMSKSNVKEMQRMQNYFNSVEISGGAFKGNSNTTTVTVSMKQNDKNAFLLLVELLNEMR